MTEKRNYLIHDSLNAGGIANINIDTDVRDIDNAVLTQISISYNIGDLSIYLTVKQTKQLANIFLKHAQHAYVVDKIFESPSDALDRVEKGKCWLKEFKNDTESNTPTEEPARYSSGWTDSSVYKEIFRHALDSHFGSEKANRPLPPTEDKS